MDKYCSDAVHLQQNLQASSVHGLALRSSGPAGRDNLRGFFEQCFSLLLKQIFGFDGSSWLNIIAKVCACYTLLASATVACGSNWYTATCRYAGSTLVEHPCLRAPPTMQSAGMLGCMPEHAVACAVP